MGPAEFAIHGELTSGIGAAWSPHGLPRKATISTQNHVIATVRASCVGWGRFPANGWAAEEGRASSRQGGFFLIQRESS